MCPGFDSKTFVCKVQCLSSVSHVLSGTSAHNKFTFNNEEMSNYWLMHVFNVCVHAYQCTSVSSFKKLKIKWYCIFMHLVLSCQDVSSLGGYLPRCFIFGQGNILPNLFGFCCQDVSSLGGYLPRCFIFRRGSLNKFKHCSICASIHIQCRKLCLPIAMCVIEWHLYIFGYHA